jgi:pyruvate/2-oxoglutarate dehydrogenase complex dihydrolipoamide dehydrogenase (E3) component
MSPRRTEPFDAIIIGTGQAGKPLAGAFAEAGWKTAIIERDRVGGTCVVRGCTPTKTMVASARVAHLARRAGDYGVESGSVTVDMEAVRRRKRTIVDEWSEGSREGMTRHETLELIMGDARFVDERAVEVRLQDGGTRRLRGEKVFINTGGRPRVPDLPGLDAVPFLDSTSIMELGEVPGHLIVLGGGFIGLEFAQMFRRFGAPVTILQRGRRLAAREDEDVSDALREILEEDGIDVRTEAKATSVAASGRDGVSVRFERGGEEDELTGSHLLVAVGRTPNTDSLAPEATGLSTDPRGFVPVNERLETAVEGIWALGDVAGSPPFTHMAYDDYRVVRANLLDDADRTTEGRISTYTVFVDPQLGRVGMTEKEARASGAEVAVAKLPMSRVARAMETDETRGFMKAVVDRGSERILGATVLGVEGGEIAAVLQVAMMGRLPFTALRDGVFAHPTFSESLNTLFTTLSEP